MKIYIAQWYDKKDKMFRLAGAYKTYRAACKRMVELGDGAVHTLTVGRAVRFAHEARRSAEKGKAEVKYECGCPPRFRVDPKEGKQYEAYCSQHHKPLRRPAEKRR